jgi:hypothetical protein
MPKTRLNARRCNPSKAPKFASRGWTMASIKGRSIAAGSPFFSRDTRRFFGPEKFSGPYEGPGGVYFVKHSSRTGTVIYRFDPETGDIDFQRFAAEGEALADVRNAAKALARAPRANPSLAEIRAGASRMASATASGARRAYALAAPHARRAASATASGARKAYHFARPKVKAGTRRALMAVSDYSARGARALDEGAHRCNPPSTGKTGAPAKKTYCVKWQDWATGDVVTSRIRAFSGREARQRVEWADPQTQQRVLSVKLVRPRAR